MQLLIQRIIDGLSNGSLYGALALALIVVYQASGRVNLAQGELATFGTYVSLVLTSPATPALAGTTVASQWLPGAPWPLGLAIAGAMVVAAVVAILVERLVVRRVAGRDIRSAVSVTIALMLAVNGAIRWLWQNRSRGYRSPFPNAPEDFVSVAGARLRYTTVGIWLTLLVVVALLALVLRSTKAGLAFRAVSSSPENAALMGVRSGRVLSGAWGLAAAIGALAGCMLASRLILDPNMMLRLIVYSFAAATIGGLSSAGGALLGGLIVGVGQSLLGGYVGFVGSNLTITAMVVLMVALLVLRPAGLFGSRRVSRF